MAALNSDLELQRRLSVVDKGLEKMLRAGHRPAFELAVTNADGTENAAAPC